ncbi:AraC family transcriptional regulator [Hoyosella altamirensis]|nr:AraC family transcriptional regulator [Hoyosella altamirensis]
MLNEATGPSWDHTRSAVAARILVEIGESRGLTGAAALAGTGLQVSDLHDPGAEIEAGQELAIARNLLRRLGDRPGLGVEAGSRYTLGSFGIWGFTMITSPTVRDLARLGTRYSALSFAFIRPVYVEDDTGARIIFDDTEIPDDVRDFFAERELAKMLTLAPVIVGTRPGFRIETRFDGPRANSLRLLAPRADIRVAKPEHAIGFTRHLLDDAMPQADPVTARVMQAQCAEILQKRRKRRGVAAHVRARILARLDDPPGMVEIARHMQIDERTLRRKLADDGTSYRELADEVHSTMARELLIGCQLTIEEVATRLGYNDAAAFSRAFKRWTGQRPGSLRDADRLSALPSSPYRGIGVLRQDPL